jgi:hypothetical protein
VAAGTWIGGEWVLGDVGGPAPLAWSLPEWLEGHPTAALGLCGSGRGALRRLLEAAGVPTGSPVLLPAYGCPALTQAVTAAGAVPVYYPGDGGLRPLWSALWAEARRSGALALILVHAFGVLQDREALARLVGQVPLAVFEDCSHTLCNAPGIRFLGPPLSTGVFASLRKVLPVPDGGLWVVWAGPRAHARRLGRGLDEGTSGPPSEFAKARANAFALPPGPARHRALQEAERLLDTAPPDGGTSPGAVTALRALADAPPERGDRWRARCRANWEALATGLRGTQSRPLLDRLPDGVCPAGFPVRHPNRTRLATRLLAAGVEATLHWPVAPGARRTLTPEERLLAGTELTLPCDGRYGQEDMERLAALCR